MPGSNARASSCLAWCHTNTIVPDPNKTDHYDRYAYTNNNPIIYTDPSGHVGLAGGLIGGAIGGMVGAFGYFFTNMKTFDTQEYFTAVGAGAVAGALIGSGMVIAAAPETSAALSVAASAMIGAGTSAGMTEAGYLASNIETFESKPFLQDTAIQGTVGGVTAICPMTSLGVAAKGITYIAGSEVQYAMNNPDWTVEGAKKAAWIGTLGAAFDVGVSYGASTSFMTQGYYADNVWPGPGYPRNQPVLKLAAVERGKISSTNAISNIASGYLTSITLSRAKVLKDISHYGD